MNEYAAAAHTGGQAVVWVTAVGSACCVVLTIMTLLEIRKFSRWSVSRWSDELSRERRRGHAEAMRRLEEERRHAARMRELEARIAAMRGSE